MERAFVGIDVAFAKNKQLPVVASTVRHGALEPLPLRLAVSKPPRGAGNAQALRRDIRQAFAKETADYLRAIEREFDVVIDCIAIDAPSQPKADGSRRRRCEVELDERHISCFTTPSAGEFAQTALRASAHLMAGGEEARLPGANQLWMLVGFDLFSCLRREWECLEVYPQAIVRSLGAGQLYKSSSEGQLAQLTAAARYTGWPGVPRIAALRSMCYGSVHDRLDAYLSSWVASLSAEKREPLGCPPDDAIWIPRLKVVGQGLTPTTDS